ncbi:MAG: D-glycerate dehydrogenase [Proteobacteria bacterium]|nr:D-glycerate dehydrogenase [Pseudomonadota bacterium]
MRKPSVVVTARWPLAVEQVLQSEFEVTLNESDRPFTADDMRSALASADALCPTVIDALPAEILGDARGRCRLLANFGVGFNHIDVAHATRLGIAVSNTPGVLTDCTADLALLLMLSIARRAGEGERQVRSSQWRGWRPTHLLGQSLAGKTLGIIGMGRIGQAVAKRAGLGFGMRVLYHSRSVVSVPGVDIERLDLDDLLARADFVSLHCPSNPQTHHLLNSESLGKMKKEAYLINTARGDVVDELALVEALRNGVIAGAGLDVYEKEPQIQAGLIDLENVVLLPHLGSASVETRTAMGMCVVNNLRAFFQGKPLPDPVVVRLTNR